MPVPSEFAGLKKFRPVHVPLHVDPTHAFIWSVDPVAVLELHALVALMAVLAGSLMYAVKPFGTPSVNSTIAFSRVGSASMAFAFFNSCHARYRPSAVPVSDPDAKVEIIISMLS